ncbi:Lipoprotein signal peptidase [Apilactobacillus kunkeei]|uniref:Lipoprotein signal peptidase n=1 Tax=Apilactobacillus kunkeei DSM 12361 = ATCC 700308 TaxID=1423768 RepID=A0A0R1FSV0_9LACO|nr:signal peptidase II [Apilactobacillus kunkeei]KOY72952.1 Lipoprotein signal peptidase [Apilactobacillus kunkeei DSM 12361 = ATCC 700308]KRK24793.1 lipoprotein signal peptidase [Apilactobacillus kunkeei DSM 12361 = ATCC 700308]CAI2592287.1 Lipoprotein signal peptidase [Apilactobacillus kunkeei]CAI2592999.1 Lipoprotein signal peptidase [Apilactobacillus kunkeei]CAI2593130.1 Lipoprotein signal peptidase [Apilactobacillus kunkeei]
MPIVYILISLCALVGIDQAIKIWISANISETSSTTIIPGVLSITNLHNSGAAWSILEGQQWLFSIITLVAVVAIVYFMIKLEGRKLYLTSTTILLAGILGNFINRFLQGYVVDMFQVDFINFPVFNFADICITFGIILLFFAILRDGDLD